VKNGFVCAEWRVVNTSNIGENMSQKRA